MSYQAKVRQQLRDFYSRLGPNERRKIKHALTELAHEHGDIRALRERLEGYYRLRVGTYRILFRYQPGRIIECVYMNSRSLVYDVFESELHRIIGELPTC